jgi:hypothetical protein
MGFITWYHVLVLMTFALLKLCVVYSQQEDDFKKEGKELTLKLHFKDRWDNWVKHFIAMWGLLLILPPLVEFSGELVPVMKKIKDITSLTMLATAAIGYFGHDGVVFIIDFFKKK